MRVNDRRNWKEIKGKKDKWRRRNIHKDIEMSEVRSWNIIVWLACFKSNYHSVQF